MFGFMSMMGNYESRKVDRYEDEDTQLTVSTASVTDSEYPYETAVSHPSYNDGSFIIVESYSSLKEAKAGHIKWKDTMTAKELPEQLNDVMTSEIAGLLKSVGGKRNFKKKAAKGRK